MPKLLIVSTLSVSLKSFLLPYAHYFRSCGWQVDAAAQDAADDPACVAAFDSTFDIDWSRTPGDIKTFLAAPGQIRKIVMYGAYDLVHVHTPVGAFVTRYALRNLRRSGGPKVIYTAHGFHFHPGGSRVKNCVYLGLEKLAGRWTDYLIVMNRADTAAAHRHRIVPPERLRYMPGIGLDTKFYSPDSVPVERVAIARRQLGLAVGDILFLTIAEFIPRKRHCDVLRALSLVARNLVKDKRIHIAFAGTGPLENEMKMLANDLGVAANVHFLGLCEDVRPFILASAGTILASAQEGLPRSLLESLSLGVPTIGSDIRGVRDILENGSGLLVKTGDTQGFANAMQTLVQQPEMRRVMGKTGRIQMMDYDIRELLRLHDTLYTEALGSPKTVPDWPEQIRLSASAASGKS